MKRNVLIYAILTVSVLGSLSYLYFNKNSNINQANTKKEFVVNAMKEPMTFETLTVGSDLIIEGTVENIDKAKKVANGEYLEKIVTDVNVKINKVYLGEYSSNNLIVRLKYGETDTEVFKNPTEATLTNGETSIMFLRKSKNNNENPHYYFVGGKSGSFTKPTLGESWNSKESKVNPIQLVEIINRYKNDNEKRKNEDKEKLSKTKEQSEKESLDEAIKSGVIRNDIEEFTKNNKDKVGKRISE